MRSALHRCDQSVKVRVRFIRVRVNEMIELNYILKIY